MQDREQRNNARGQEVNGRQKSPNSSQAHFAIILCCAYSSFAMLQGLLTTQINALLMVLFNRIS
jgi:hypothetical protein